MEVGWTPRALPALQIMLVRDGFMQMARLQVIGIQPQKEGGYAKLLYIAFGLSEF